MVAVAAGEAVAMAWWGWLLGLLVAHLLVIALQVTIWELWGKRVGLGTDLVKPIPN